MAYADPFEAAQRAAEMPGATAESVQRAFDAAVRANQFTGDTRPASTPNATVSNGTGMLPSGVGYNPVEQRNKRFRDITSALMANPLQTVNINALYQEDPELAKMVQTFVNTDAGFRAAESAATSSGPSTVAYAPPPTFSAPPAASPAARPAWMSAAPTSANWTDPGANWDPGIPSAVQSDPGALLPGGWQGSGNAPVGGGQPVAGKQVSGPVLPPVDTDTSPGGSNVPPGGFDPSNGVLLANGDVALGNAPQGPQAGAAGGGQPGSSGSVPDLPVPPGGAGGAGDSNGVTPPAGGTPPTGTPPAGGGGPFDNAAATGDEPPDFGGDVFQWEPPVNNLLPQMEGLYQNMFDTLNGTRKSPYLQPLLDDFEVRNTRAQDNFEQGLAVRGIANSTLADNARQNYNIQAEGGKTALALDTLNKEFTPQLALLGQVFNQGQAGRQQALNEFMQFLQAQYSQDALQNTNAQNALSLMLNAMGINTAPGAAPNNFTVPQNNNPSAASSAANFGGNAFLTWLMSQ